MGGLAFGVGSLEWSRFNGVSLAAVLLMIATIASYGLERFVERRKKLLEVVTSKIEVEPLLRPATKQQSRRELMMEWLWTGILCGWMMVCSVSIIYTNAWILDNMCPHAATLTAVQQAFGGAAAYVCVHWLKVTEPLDISARTYLTYLVPLAAAFTVYLWGSNAAYVYLAPGFVQMIKPLGSAIVFVVATALGLEQYTNWKLLNFLLICAGISLTSFSKSGSDEASQNELVTGLCVLIGAYVVVAFYNTGLQIIQRKGSLATKFNPLTSLLYIAPAACVFLSIYAASVEWTSHDFHCFDKLPWWLMLFDCLVAFVFNLSMMLFIGRLSAVAYSLFAFLKEIVLVVVAFCFFQEPITRPQLEGYAVTTLAVIVWQHRKIHSR